jgi:uncharacterized membrane protein
VPGSQSHHAFLWKHGVMTDLGLVAPGPCSTAIGVNSKDQVIVDTGICNVGGGPPGFSEHGQPMVDINTLVLPGSDLQVVSTFSINERGEIAGLGALSDGDVHAVVLVPQGDCDDECEARISASQHSAAATGLNPNRGATLPNGESVGARANSIHNRFGQRWAKR